MVDMRRFRPSIVKMMFFGLIFFISCGRDISRDLLSDIESYIDSRPDSALAAIRQIDTTALHGRAVKAKYSLLHAIALATTSSCSPFRQVNDIRENSIFNRFYSTFHARFSPFWDLDY